MEDPDADCSRASLDLYIETLEENHGGIHQPHAQPSPVHVSSMSSFDLYADLDDSDEKMETDSTDVSDTNGNEKPSPSLQLQSSIDGDSSRTQEKGNVDWWVSAHRDLKEKYAVLEEKYATLNKNMMSLCVTARTEIKKKDKVISHLRKALAMAKSSMASASKSVVTVTTGTSPVTITRCDAAVSTDTISHQGVGDCTVGGTNCNQQAVIHGDISGGEICSVTQSLPITHSPQLLSSLGSLQGLQLPDSTQSPLGSQPSGSSEKLESLQNSEDGCELPQGSQSQSPEYSHVQPKLLPGLQPPESTQAGSSHGSPNQGSSHGSPAQHLSHAAERSFEECGSSTHWSPRGPSSSGSLCSLPEGHTLGLLAQRPPQGSPSAMSAQGSQADLPAEGSHCSAANTFSPSPGSCGESLSPVSHHDSPATSNHSPPSSRDSSPVSRGSPGFSHCAETLQGSQLPPRSGQTSVVYTTEPKLSALPGVDMKDGGDSSSQAGVGCGNTLQDSAMHISEAVGFSRLNSKACVDMALKMDTSTNLEHIAAGVEHGHKADITDTVHIKSNYDINNDLSSSPTQSSSMVCSQPEGQTLALVMQHSGLPDLPLKVNIDKNADVDTVSDSRQQPGVSALHDEKEYMNASFPKSSSICNGQDANCTQKNKEVLEHVSPMSSKSTCEESADGGVIASNTQPPLSVCASVGGHNRTPSHPEAGETSPKLAPLRQSAAVLEGHAQKFGLRSSISLNCDVHKVPDQHDPFESDDTGILSPSPTHTVDRLSFEKTAASVPNTLGVGHAARTEMRAGSGSCTGKLNKKVRQQKAKPVNGDLAQSADSKPFLQDVEGKAWRAKLKLWPPGVCDVIRKPRPRVHGQQMDFVHNKWKSPTREYKSDLGCSETANVPSLKEVLPHCQLETGQHDKLSDSEKDKDADHLPKGGIAAESKDSVSRKKKKKKEKKKKSKKSSKTSLCDSVDSELSGVVKKERKEPTVDSDSGGNSETKEKVPPVNYLQPCELASSTRLDVGQTRSTDSKENRQKHSHSGQKETAKGSEQVPTKENVSLKTVLTEVSPQVVRKNDSMETREAVLDLPHPQTLLAKKSGSLSPKKKGPTTGKGEKKKDNSISGKLQKSIPTSLQSINCAEKAETTPHDTVRLRGPNVSEQPKHQTTSRDDKTSTERGDSHQNRVNRERLNLPDTSTVTADDSISIHTDNLDGDASPFGWRRGCSVVKNRSFLRRRSVGASGSADFIDSDLTSKTRRASVGAAESEHFSQKSCKTPLTHSDKVPPAAYPGVKSTSPENHPSTLSDYSSQKCVNFENSAEAMEQETPKLEISVQAAATVQASSEEMTTTVMKEELRSAEPLRKNPLSLFGTVEVSPVKDMAISSEGCAALSPADGKQLQHRLKPSIVPSLLWSPDKTLMSKPVLENPMSSRSYNAFLGLAECSVTMDDSNMLTAHSVGKDDTTTRIDTVDTQKGEVTFSGIVSEKSASDGLIHCPVTASQSIVDAGISGCDTKGDDDSSSYSNSQPMDFNSPLFGYPSHSVKLRGGSGFKFQRKHVAFASSSSTSLSSTTTSGCVSSTSLSSTSLTSQSPAAPPPQLAAIPSKVGSTRRRSLGFDVTVSPHDAVGDVNTHLAPVEKICAKECLPQQERVELGLHAGPADGDMTSSKPVALAQELEDGELENTSTLPGYAVGSSVSHTAPSVFDIIEQSLEEGELRSSDSFTNSFDKRCKLVSTSLKVSSPPQVLECAAGDNAQFADLKEVLKQKTQTISDVRKPSEKASSAHSRSHNTSPEVTDFKNTFEASGRSDTKLTVGSVPAHGSVASCLKACDVNEQARLAEKEPASCNRQTQQEEHVAFEGQPTNGAEWNQEDHSGDDKKCGPTTQTTLTAKRRLSSSSKDSPPSKRRHASSAFSLTQGNEHHGCDFGSVEDKTQKATNLHETASELSKRVSGSVCATVEKSGQVPNAALDEPDDEIVCVDSCEGTDQEDSVVDDGVCVSESELELPGCARTRVYRKFAAAGTVEMTEDGVADNDSGDMVEEDGGNDESSGEGSEGGDENGLDGSDHEAEEEDRETGDMADTSEDEEGRCSCDEMSDEEDNVPGEEMHPDEDEDNEDKENETPEEMREKIESDSEASDDEDSDAGVQAGDKRPTRCSHSGSEFEQSGSDIDGRDSHFPGGGRGEGQPLHQLQSHVTNREELLESEDEHSKLSDDLVLSSDSEHDEVFEREEMLENDLPSLEALGDPVAESSCRKLSGGGCEDSSTSGDLVPVASDTTFIIDDKGMGKGGDVLSSAGGNILTAVTPVVREGSHAGSFSQRPNWSMDCISLEAPEGSSLLVEHRDTSFHTSTSGRVFAAVASERLHDGDKQREERSKPQVHSQIATGCMLETDSAAPETLVPAAKHSSRQSKSKQKSRKTSESAGGASKKRNCRVDGKDSSDRDKQVSISERLCKLSEGSVCSNSQRGPADRTDDPECSMNKRDARADQTEPGGSKNFGTRSKHAGRGSHAHEKHGSKSKESRKPAHALGRHHSDSRSGSRERSHTVHGRSHHRSVTPERHGHNTRNPRKSGLRARSPVVYPPCACCAGRRRPPERGSTQRDRHARRGSPPHHRHREHDGHRTDQSRCEHRSRHPGNREDFHRHSRGTDGCPDCHLSSHARPARRGKGGAQRGKASPPRHCTHKTSTHRERHRSSEDGHSCTCCGQKQHCRDRSWSPVHGNTNREHRRTGARHSHRQDRRRSCSTCSHSRSRSRSPMRHRHHH